MLFERIDENYPDVFVWLTQVEDEPIGTITLFVVTLNAPALTVAISE